MSSRRKFEWMPFIDGCTGETILAFDLDKYTKDEVLEISTVELDAPIDEIDISMNRYYCYYGFGINTYDEVENGYYLSESVTKNSFPVWTAVRKEID